jgi:hypothetical protein
MRAILNREIVVRLRVDDEGGRLVDADTTPTVVVTDGNGDPIAGVTVDQETTGVYTATVPAQTTVDRLVATWETDVAGFGRTVTIPVDLIAERLVPLWRLREDEVLTDLETHVLVHVADTIEEWMRNALKFPAVVEAWRGSWIEPYPTHRLRIPGVVYPVDVYALAAGNGTHLDAYTSGELAELVVVDTGFEVAGSTSGLLAGTPYGGAFPAGPYTAHVAHGLTDPGEDLRRAAAILARYTARVSNLPERARRILTENTEIDLSMPSPDRPTGLPDVDAVIGRYRLQAL